MSEKDRESMDEAPEGPGDGRKEGALRRETAPRSSVGEQGGEASPEEADSGDGAGGTEVAPQGGDLKQEGHDVDPGLAAGVAEEAGETRCGFVAIIGAPNAGKSTLINTLVGAKVSIVTHKVQTTRTRVRAVAIVGNAQIIFVDTPGIFQPRRRLDEAMVDAAWAGAADADVVALLVDARRGLDDDNRRILEGLKKTGRRCILVLNKIDLIEKPKLLELADVYNREYPFEATFMISALKGSGVDDLRDYLAEQMPPGPWLYPPDQLSDFPLRTMAAEITREKLYLRLHDELPYASHVETELWEERPDGSIRIEQTIYVQRESQKKIVIGKGGQTIKAIGKAAREEISAMLGGRKVHLFLFVKVREKWDQDPDRLRFLGLLE
jgi:GTP-binding protein Era